MIIQYLQEIGKIEVNLIHTKKIGEISFNSAVFGEKLPENLELYKKRFLKELKNKKKLLEKLEKNILLDNKLTEKYKQFLNYEIFVKIKKIEFLKLTYDIEANKIDSSYKIKEEIENYDYYNKIFYGVSQKNLKQKITISKNKNFNIFISKEQLLELLKFAKKIISELSWDFGDYTGLSHSQGLLKIPEQKEYNIKRIIVIFFHEMTHLFRYLNGKKNLGFNYTFERYMDLEEGIATYNEYFYGNKILDYGKYNAYYDKSYQVLLEDISEKEKIEKLYNILKNKGFQKEQIKNYYNRFHKFSRKGGKKFFLKDLTYTSAYQNVLKLIKNDKNNYNKILSGRIGLYELENNLLNFDKNIYVESFFDIMVEKIKSLI